MKSDVSGETELKQKFPSKAGAKISEETDDLTLSSSDEDDAQGDIQHQVVISLDETRCYKLKF